MNTEVYTQPFIDLWFSLVHGLARLLPAILIFVIGLAIAHLVYKGVVHLIKGLKVDDALKPTWIAQSLEKTGHPLNVGKVIGFLVKWFIIIGFLIIALDLLRLEATKYALLAIVSYIPQVIFAAIILFVGFLVADFLKKLVRGSSKLMAFASASLLGQVTYVAVVVFTILTVLEILGIQSYIINALVIGIIAMLSLAGGLAFGLGGKEAAKDAIEHMKKAVHK